MEAPQPTRKPDSSSSSQPDRWRCHGELDMGVVERAAAVAGLVGATLPTNSTNSQRCEPFERSRANGATPKCPRSLGMIQGGTMLSSASTSPAVATRQPQSASADSGFVLPSFPRFQSISQPIFISSGCGPPPEGAHPPPRLARPNCAAARFQAQDDRRARQSPPDSGNMSGRPPLKRCPGVGQLHLAAAVAAIVRSRSWLPDA